MHTYTTHQVLPFLAANIHHASKDPSPSLMTPAPHVVDIHHTQSNVLPVSRVINMFNSL